LFDQDLLQRMLLKQQVTIDCPCHSCMEKQQEEDCFFNHIMRLTEDATRRKEEHPTMAQESLRKYDLYV